MYISSWPGLTPHEFLQRRSDEDLPYPLNAANRLSFCVARSGIYHLFRALKFKKEDIVLVPDYHSGNEVSAIQAAGATIVYYPILRNLEPDLDGTVASGQTESAGHLRDSLPGMAAAHERDRGLVPPARQHPDRGLRSSC